MEELNRKLKKPCRENNFTQRAPLGKPIRKNIYKIDFISHSEKEAQQAKLHFKISRFAS